MPYRTFMLLLGFAAMVAGCNEVNQYQAPPPPQVTVAQPTSEQVTDYLEFTGTTRATDVVNLRARVNGYLKSVEFKDGQQVKKGDLLFVIEQEPFQAALAAAKASQQKAEASLRLAEAEVKRTAPLVKRGALPEQELDVKNADLATAEADVASAKASVTQAELNVGYTHVVAPISGRIGRKLADVGNLVQAEMTVLATIESYSPIYVYFTVGEGDVLRLMDMQAATAAGTAAEVATAGPQTPREIHMGLGNEQGYPHKGMLEFTDLGVDPSTGTQLRRGTFENENLSLVPGLFARIRLPIGKPEPQLLVSERAISTDQRGEYVLVVGADNTVEYRPVKLGTTFKGMRVVEDGLKDGEWIVVNGLQRARPGAKVDPKREEPTAVAAAGEKTAAVDAPSAAASSTTVSAPVTEAVPTSDTAPESAADSDAAVTQASETVEAGG